MEREIKILIFILILAFVLRVIFAFSSSVLWWDEAVYADLGYDLSHNPLDYSFNHGWSDFVPSGGNLIYAWPKAGFRAPLLPYFLSLFYFLRIDFLLILLMPLIGTLSVFFVYIMGKKLFSLRAGLYSSLLFALLPLHVIFSGKILTDVLSTFFVLLTFFCFWEGFEENKNKFKVLFGFFLALALLTRYTVLWIIPVFLIYFLIRDQGIKFIREKYLWYSILVFFIILTPLFIYGYLSYGNFLGAIIHGLKAASYWGGTQPGYFFLSQWYNMFYLIGFIFVISIIYIFYKKEFLKKEIYLLLIWIFFFLIMASLMPHKEERFILPITPVLCLLSGFFLHNLKINIKKIILIILFLLLAFNLVFLFINISKTSYNINSECFKQTINFLMNTEKDSLMISENPPIIYYFVKHESSYYPDNLNEENIKNILVSNRTVYFVFTKLGSGYENKKFLLLKNILNKNYKLQFNCSLDSEVNFVYSNK